jgi:hypothetical protein
MITLFPQASTVNEARRQMNVIARAKTLFLTEDYDWYIADRNPYLFGVCGPQGQHYGVDVEANTCTCKGFESDGDCKHRIAVAGSEECRDASLCRVMEMDNAIREEAEHLIFGCDPYSEV